MRLIQSSKFSLPTIYFVENEDDLLKLPLGIPFVRGNESDYNKYVKLFEWEILLKSAISTGLPFKWSLLLKKNGYRDSLTAVAGSSPSVYFLDEEWERSLDEEWKISNKGIQNVPITEYVADISYQVDMEVLKALKILPAMYLDIEKAVNENILNTITYNPSLYNKKLGLVTGATEYSPPEKNLIIIDVSSSIPVSISKAILLMSKTMSASFYADIIVTGDISTFYDYTEIDQLDVEGVYTFNGRGNEGKIFNRILESTYRKYNTAIVFGDYDNPSSYGQIPIVKGKENCNWQIENVISFHTKRDDILAGYAEFFTPKNITYMKNWVKYLD
jgi:hypothetical protein